MRQRRVVREGVVCMAEFAQSELQSIERDAASSAAKTPAERVDMFVDLITATDAILAGVSPSERVRRLRIADELDPRPKPWWRHIRREALDEYRCRTSST